MADLQHKVEAALASLAHAGQQPKTPAATPEKWTRKLAAKAKAALDAVATRRQDAPPDGYHVDHKAFPAVHSTSGGFYWFCSNATGGEKPQDGPFHTWSRANKAAWRDWSRKQARK